MQEMKKRTKSVLGRYHPYTHLHRCTVHGYVSARPHHLSSKLATWLRWDGELFAAPLLPQSPQTPVKFEKAWAEGSVSPLHNTPAHHYTYIWRPELRQPHRLPSFHMFSSRELI